MKNHLLIASLCAAALVPTCSNAEITIEAFYDPLDSYGDWIDVGDYGYCWQPHDTGSDWRPYTVGEWVYTDAGWTWDSDEPFGWATYHYGHWVRLARQGWVWVPDTQWAPAWVSWRHSDRYTGWAPLPPESRVSVGVSLGGWVDAYFDLGPSSYSFVETRYLGAPRLASVLVPSRQNITIINETRNVTNIKVVNNVIINNGPDYNLVAQRAERPIRKLRLAREEVTSVNALTKAKIEGDTIKIATPRLAAQAGAKPRKVARKIERAEIDDGWQNAGPAPEVEKAREKLRAEAKVPENLPTRDVARERMRTAARGDKAPKEDAAAAKTETGARGAETATVPAETGVSPTADPTKARQEKAGKEKAGEKKQAETPPTADSAKRPKNQPEPLPQREPEADKPELTEPSPTTQPKAAKPQSDASQAEKRQEKAKRNRPETDQTPTADQPKERNPETAKPQGDAAQAERRQEKAQQARAQADQAAAAAAARQKEQAERVKAQASSVEKPAVQRSKPAKPESPEPSAAQPRPERAKPAENPPQAKVQTDKPRKVEGKQPRNERPVAAAPQRQAQPQRPKMSAAANPNRPAQVSPAPGQGQPQAAKKEGKKKGGKAEENQL